MGKHDPLILLSFMLVFIQACQREFSPSLITTDGTEQYFVDSLAPFFHGVASGDPSVDGVLIWTRVTPSGHGKVEVRWEVSKDEGFDEILQTGDIPTGQERDYTVKVEPKGLQENTTFYYRFHALGGTSITGRFKTLPIKNIDTLRLASVSCTNFQWGYFNGLSALAVRKDVDYILHLGDYIYEYAAGTYADTSLGRPHLPPHEIITLQDYRTRYAQYRLDPAYRDVHRNHCFITTWDDHEFANNAYTEGAHNHQPEEGDYIERRENARRAYFEWMPVREVGSKPFYRNFSFGDLAQLVVLDERLEGRTRQPEWDSTGLKTDPGHTLLGKSQLLWLEEQLADTRARWKIVGSSVVFTEFANQWGSRNMDAFDGYPGDRERLSKFLQNKDLKDVIFLSGDTHVSLAFEVPGSIDSYRRNPLDLLAVEFGTPSVNSANKDEAAPMQQVLETENLLRSSAFNPHLKYINMHDHGYFLLTLTAGEALAEWWYTPTVKVPSHKEELAARFRVLPGSHLLKRVR